ncbi:MAG: hypothetical protein JJT96_19795 [Opitutales bacterium]|nr:hypothetical protein [Opitutales bacterium]
MKTKLSSFFVCALLAAGLSAQQGGERYDEEEEWWYDDECRCPGEWVDDPRSSGAVTDGNPISSVALAAREVALSSALLSEAEAMEVADLAEVAATASEVTGASSLDIDFGGGSGKIDGTDFDIFTLRVPYSRDLSQRGRLNLLMPLSFTRLKNVLPDDAGVQNGNASIYGAGLNAAYRYRVIDKSDGKPYRWNITPSAGLFLRESSDLNQGAWVYSTAISSSFAYRLDENWIVNLGNSLSLAWNSGRKSYPDPIRDNQQVLINGLQVFYLDGRWMHHAYIMDTRFLRTSFIDNFQSIGAGTSFRLTQNRSLRASVVYEAGSRYHAFRAMFGSSWRF